MTTDNRPTEGAPEVADSQGMNYLVSLPRRVVTVYMPLSAFRRALRRRRMARACGTPGRDRSRTAATASSAIAAIMDRVSARWSSRVVATTV